ncbi:hypothetical protein JCM10207_001731 [Rhodosporidiobolus poonsookiae]
MLLSDFVRNLHIPQSLFPQQNYPDPARAASGLSTDTQTVDPALFPVAIYRDDDLLDSVSNSFGHFLSLHLPPDCHVPPSEVQGFNYVVSVLAPPASTQQTAVDHILAKLQDVMLRHVESVDNAPKTKYPRAAPAGMASQDTSRSGVDQSAFPTRFDYCTAEIQPYTGGNQTFRERVKAVFHLVEDKQPAASNEGGLFASSLQRRLDGGVFRLEDLDRAGREKDLFNMIYKILVSCRAWKATSFSFFDGRHWVWGEIVPMGPDGAYNVLLSRPKLFPSTTPALPYLSLLFSTFYIHLPPDLLPARVASLQTQFPLPPPAPKPPPPSPQQDPSPDPDSPPEDDPQDRNYKGPRGPSSSTQRETRSSKGGASAATGTRTGGGTVASLEALEEIDSLTLSYPSGAGPVNNLFLRTTLSHPNPTSTLVFSYEASSSDPHYTPDTSYESGSPTHLAFPERAGIGATGAVLRGRTLAGESYCVKLARRGYVSHLRRQAGIVLDLERRGVHGLCPPVFGFFESQVAADEDEDAGAVLLMGDGGRSLASWEELDRSQGISLIHSILKLHVLGHRTHGDIHPGNILLPSSSSSPSSSASPSGPSSPSSSSPLPVLIDPLGEPHSKCAGLTCAEVSETMRALGLSADDVEGEMSLERAVPYDKVEPGMAEDERKPGAANIDGEPGAAKAERSGLARGEDELEATQGDEREVGGASASQRGGGGAGKSGTEVGSEGVSGGGSGSAEGEEGSAASAGGRTVERETGHEGQHGASRGSLDQVGPALDFLGGEERERAPFGAGREVYDGEGPDSRFGAASVQPAGSDSGRSLPPPLSGLGGAVGGSAVLEGDGDGDGDGDDGLDAASGRPRPASGGGDGGERV